MPPTVPQSAHAAPILDRHFPKFLFHAEKGPRKFKNAEELDALGDRDQWYNSPGEAEAGESLGEIEREGDVLETGGGRPLNYVSAPYPKFLFFKDKTTGETKHVKVKNPDEHEALGEGYFEHPNDIDGDSKGVAAPKGAAVSGQSTGGDGGLKPEEATAFYGAPAAQIIPGLKLCGLKDTNDLIAAEEKNPNGARAAVLDALKARRTELGGDTKSTAPAASKSKAKTSGAKAKAPAKATKKAAKK